VARFARVVAVDVPHHVTQRGNARQFVLATDQDRVVYLELLVRYAQVYHLSLIGYCLMSNHVHLVAVPHRANALAMVLKQTHGRYAAYWNASYGSSGHVWQGRFYSCPLDAAHLWVALRYAELNPVRAGLVAAAAVWPWSSAAAHCGAAEPSACLQMDTWAKRWSIAAWRQFLAETPAESELASVRQCTHTGRPLGTPEFVASLEQVMGCPLAPQKSGRRGKIVGDDKQEHLAFG